MEEYQSRIKFNPINKKYYFENWEVDYLYKEFDPLRDREFLDQVKIDYFNHRYFISIDSMNSKLRKKKLFEKKDAWFNLKLDKDFRKLFGWEFLVPDETELKEYKYDDFDFSVSLGTEMLSMINRVMLTSRFGIGDSREGFFFTYKSIFCLLSDGKIAKNEIYDLTRPDMDFSHIRFINQDLNEIFKLIRAKGINIFINYDKRLIQDLDFINNEIEEELKTIGENKFKIIDGSAEISKLINLHNAEIIALGITYNQNFIEKFMKISNFLELRFKYLHCLHQEIYETKNLKKIKNSISDFYLLINAYYLTTLHSINLLIALTQNNLITYYSIYEKLDALNIFESNWEKLVVFKLDQINSSIQILNDSVINLEKNVINELSNLSYSIANSLDNMTSQIIVELDNLNSNSRTNNLISIFQLQQLSRLNKKQQ